jgi:hypothetical protein
MLLFDCEEAQCSGDLTMNSFGQLLHAISCPICGDELSVEEKAGKRVLVCKLHGEMKAYLDVDPRAALARVCGGLGIGNLEVS